LPSSSSSSSYHHHHHHYMVPLSAEDFTDTMFFLKQ
jgi:hypothetical protein